jgi:hypothetical protein
MFMALTLSPQVRGKQHRERDPELWYRNRCLDIKYLGVPGE